VAECTARETQVPSTGSCKESKSLAFPWEHGVRERSQACYPRALPRCKGDKAQGEGRAPNIFQVLSVMEYLWSDSSATPAFCVAPTPRAQLKPAGLRLRCETTAYPDVGPDPHRITESQNHRITEAQNSSGWKRPLWVI